MTNEIKHPYVVEIALVRDGLDVELSRRIMQFHKSRHIQPAIWTKNLRLVLQPCRAIATAAGGAYL